MLPRSKDCERECAPCRVPSVSTLASPAQPPRRRLIDSQWQHEVQLTASMPVGGFGGRFGFTVVADEKFEHVLVASPFDQEAAFGAGASYLVCRAPHRLAPGRGASEPVRFLRRLPLHDFAEVEIVAIRITEEGELDGTVIDDRPAKGDTALPERCDHIVNGTGDVEADLD